MTEDREAEMGSSEMKRLKLERKEQISGEEKESEFAQNVQKAVTHCRGFCSERAECTLLVCGYVM